MLKYRYQEGTPQAPQVKLKLTNNSQQVLYCNVLDLTERYAIVAGLFVTESVRLEPGQSAWALDGKPITSEIPKEMYQQGYQQCQDILKLIASTSSFDANLLTQEKLSMSKSRSISKLRLAGKSGLKGLMRELTYKEINRDLSTSSVTDDDWEGWTTDQVLITTKLN